MMASAHNKFSRVTTFAFPYVLILVTAMFALTLVTSLNAKDQADTNHAALCAFKVDLAARIDQGQQFLRKHPEGAFGFSAAQIKLQLENQQRTYRSFSSVDC